MKRFLITYAFALEPDAQAAWHARIAELIAALDGDPELRGRIRYHCMKLKDGASYVHLAEAADDEATKLLGQREYFKRYTAETKRVSGGAVQVQPLELIAETA